MTRRIGVTLDEDLYFFHRLIPHGMKSAILSTVIRRIIAAQSKHGTEIYTAIRDGHFDIVMRPPPGSTEKVRLDAPEEMEDADTEDNDHEHLG